MTDRTLKEKASKLSDLNAQVSALQEQAERLRADITKEMESREVEELKAGNNLLRWKIITSIRFDSKLFKEAHNDLYEKYARPSTTRRFTLVSA